MTQGTWRRRAVTALPIALPTLWIACTAISGIYARLGHAGLTLDDSFIHFQYARAIAEGHPFRFQAGEPLTMGATSLLWPALLAPFYAVGFRGVALAWPAWVMSFAALGMLAHETFHLTRRLAGDAAAVGAAACVLAFSGFAWCAASGMEVVPFAWVLARAARRASEWSEETTPSDRTRQNELLALAFVAPLFRPEGAIASLFVGATLLGFRRRALPRGRLLGALACAAPIVPFAISYLLTGSARSNTAIVKLLPGNPYQVGSTLLASIVGNLRLLIGTLLNGEVWSAEFLPKGGAPLAMAGLVAIVLRGVQAKARWRALSVLATALAMLIPCVYATFLWNRLRYLWPFATGWLIGLACLARVVGDAAGSIWCRPGCAADLPSRARWRIVTPIACGAFAGLLLSRMGWTLEDVADSASGIDRQHVALGLWAKDHLPASARIGVNDTGAIAYLGDRHTFDIVGLTTPNEARYWVAGAASRVEHYERLRRDAPAILPTHFIVYPEWMGCDALLGAVLHEATVTDATILGGTTMRVYEADYARLGSGERPWTNMGELVDELDVADLESESAHVYELAGARDGEEIVRDARSPEGKPVLDGGRGARTVERFVVRLPAGKAVRGVVRLESAGATHVAVFVRGAAASSFELVAGDWGEYAFDVPPGDARAAIELRPTDGMLATFHYWFDAAP